MIYLCQNGAPTHVDLFDYKPEIVAQHGKPVPEDYFKGKRFSTMTGDPTGKSRAATRRTLQAERTKWGLGKQLPAVRRQPSPMTCAS